MNPSPNPLILASSSRYRAEMLRRLQVPFDIDAADIDETPEPAESPQHLAARLARDKARAVHARRPAAWVLGADQVAGLADGRILGKPGTVERAIEQLAMIRGREVTWHSGIALVGVGEPRVAVVDTVLRMRDLTDAEIERYVELDRPLDCAGSMRSESLGIALVESMSSDDPTALIGMPLIRVSDWLRSIGHLAP